MSKIKVYELAKELDVPSKEVIEFLGGKNIEVKNHMSSLEDADADMARKALTKGNKDAAAKPEAEAPKKKNIVHVFRPQNTQNGAKQAEGRKDRDARSPTVRHRSREGQCRSIMDALQNSRPVRQRQPKSLPSRQGRKRERQISPSSRQDVQLPQARKESRHRRGRQRDRQQTEARRQDARKEAMTAVRIPEELPGIARIARREAARSREAVHREIARIVRKATETRAASQAKGRTGAITTGEAMMPFQRLRHRHRSRSAAR